MELFTRKIDMVRQLLDCSFGTIWWVKDDIWHEVIPDFVIKRKAHPGVSIAAAVEEADLMAVPMLLGSTRAPKTHRANTVVLSGLTPPVKGKKDTLTYLGGVKPALLSRLHFFTTGKVTPIRKNDYKPVVSQDEARRIKAFLQEKLDD